VREYDKFYAAITDIRHDLQYIIPKPIERTKKYNFSSINRFSFSVVQIVFCEFKLEQNFEGEFL
jgi:hypothetical protein